MIKPENIDSSREIAGKKVNQQLGFIRPFQVLRAGIATITTLATLASLPSAVGAYGLQSCNDEGAKSVSTSLLNNNSDCIGISSSFVPNREQTSSPYSNKQPRKHVPVCNPNERFHCSSRVIVDDSETPAVSGSPAPSALTPDQLRSAYGVSGIESPNRTIAVIDAFNHPRVLSDINTYSKHFGIKELSACAVSKGTVARPCFEKVNQRGGKVYPRVNALWDFEISIDVEMVHAMCPNCNILLVETSDNTQLLNGVDTAVGFGVKILSNSYGAAEWNDEYFNDYHFNIPGIAFVFSSGDSGYGVDYPAASPFVTAVGGTSLTMNGNTYISETAWKGSGSGCSKLESIQPKWQKQLGLNGCSGRMVADVSADADPHTGVAIYDSVGFPGIKGGWFKAGGTSVAAPIVAAMYAYNNIPPDVRANSMPYTHPSNLHDIVSGSNGTCNPNYLCNADSGYDGPTGLGTPKGTAAFG